MVSRQKLVRSSDELQSEDRRSVRTALGELKDDCITLAKLEAKLAKLELSQNASKIGKLVAMIVGGVLIAFAGAIILLLGISTSLSIAFGADLAAPAASQLIVGLLSTVGGGLMAYRAILKVPGSTLIPIHSIRSIKRDIEEIKEAIS